MGLAQEWLGIEGCRSLASEILTGAVERHGEIWAHCPWHEEQTPGGAFSYNYEKDQAKCQSCGGSGDLINVWSACKGYAEKEGFLQFKKQYGKEAPLPLRKPAKKLPPEPRHLDPKDRPPAPAKWIERATSFVIHSFDRLMNSDNALQELNRRWGISMQTVSTWGLGINDKDKWIPVTSWGLPFEEKNGKEKKVWLPRGLVMPCMVEAQVRKIKIRRPEAQTPWGEPRRYWEVLGGENWRFHCYALGQPSVLVLVEAERDAALVYQACEGCSLGAIAGGGATKHPCDVETLALLKGAEVLLVALDTDLPGAKNALDFWVKEFGFAIHWPVPKQYGKDVGEAWANGLDIKEWVAAGVPQYVKNWTGKQRP